MLRHGTADEKVRMFQQLQAEARNIIDSCISLSYYMRGAIQYEDVLMRVPAERDMMFEFIKDRLETESKRPYPNY